ncbi:hypothetical protein [Streptomyces sp. JJ36]|uniref:hypothetical protein n=1 Tax=Streptomyces sp. JJ36 TaxID=2736645 RepID=UPI001F2C9BCA|nr:hypothetical protein [Streptomyces sp. JJ36]MCF6524834.1 hypothetical protein [Streptomyces sp. JJ36]
MTYSDNSQPSDEAHVACGLVLDTDDIEILFQAAHQLANYDEARLAALGCPVSFLERLIDDLREIRNRSGESSKVRIFVIARSLLEGEEGEVEGEVEAVVAEVVEEGAVALRTELSMVVAKFPEFMHFITSSMGSREFFLRAGFNVDEMESLMARLEGGLAR